MNTNARTARATIRTMRRDNRAIRAAHKAVAAGPASAKHHMIAAGVPVATAERFAGAFSRGMVATDKVTVAIKLRGRVVKRVEVKRYNADTAAARLATYRPKDEAAAALFERVAA